MNDTNKSTGLETLAFSSISSQWTTYAKSYSNKSSQRTHINGLASKVAHEKQEATLVCFSCLAATVEARHSLLWLDFKHVISLALLRLGRTSAGMTTQRPINESALLEGLQSMTQCHDSRIARILLPRFVD